jgi:hypothetical protein
VLLLGDLWLTIEKYSYDPNTGPSGFQMVIFWTLFGSGFQTVWYSDARFYNSGFWNGTKLDRFIIKNYFLFLNGLG